MENIIKFQVRVFPVMIRDERTGEKLADKIAISKNQLRAAEVAGINSEELIYRTYNRRGYRVLDINPPVKKELQVDLLELFRQQCKNESAAPSAANTEDGKQTQEASHSTQVHPYSTGFGEDLQA